MLTGLVRAVRIIRTWLCEVGLSPFSRQGWFWERRWRRRFTVAYGELLTVERPPQPWGLRLHAVQFDAAHPDQVIALKELLGHANRLEIDPHLLAPEGQSDRHGGST